MIIAAQTHTKATRPLSLVPLGTSRIGTTEFRRERRPSGTTPSAIESWDVDWSGESISSLVGMGQEVWEATFWGEIWS